VLVISKVCAGGTVLEGLEQDARRGDGRLVGRSAAGATVVNGFIPQEFSPGLAAVPAAKSSVGFVNSQTSLAGE